MLEKVPTKCVDTCLSLTFRYLYFILWVWPAWRRKGTIVVPSINQRLRDCHGIKNSFSDHLITDYPPPQIYMI